MHRQLLRSVPIDPRRAAAALCTTTFHPRDPRIDSVIVGGIGPGIYLDLAYLPGAYALKSIAQLREVGGLARDTRRPFYLCCGRYDLARERYPKEFEFVENSGLFERVAKIQGVDEQRTSVVYRWIGSHD